MQGQETQSVMRSLIFGLAKKLRVQLLTDDPVFYLAAPTPVVGTNRGFLFLEEEN